MFLLPKGLETDRSLGFSEYEAKAGAMKPEQKTDMKAVRKVFVGNAAGPHTLYP